MAAFLLLSRKRESLTPKTECFDCRVQSSLEETRFFGGTFCRPLSHILGSWNSRRRVINDIPGWHFGFYESPPRGILIEKAMVHPYCPLTTASTSKQVCSRDRHHDPSLNETFFRKFLSDARMVKHTVFFLTRFGKIHENLFQ